MLIVLLAALAMFEFALRSQPAGPPRNDAIQNAQIEVERMVRDLRQTYGVVSATATALTVLTYDSGDLRGRHAGTVARVPGRLHRAPPAPAPGPQRGQRQRPDGTGDRGPRSDTVFAYTPTTTAPTRSIPPSWTPSTAEEAITVNDGVALRNVAAVA